MPQGKPLQGEIYKHFKGNNYQVVCVAIHSESKEPMVVYKALYDEKQIYCRPLDMFISEVDKNKYPDVEQLHRFQLINEDDSDDINPILKAFLDEDNLEEKVKILVEHEASITDNLIDVMAASLDTVIAEGDTDLRLFQLKQTLRTRTKYESTRLR